MTPIASGVIIKGKGEGIKVIMDDVVNKEIELQRRREQQKHAMEMEALRTAIEQRDIVRHKMLGRKLAAHKAALHPEPNVLRQIKESCLYAISVIICIVRR